jgi:21S rRNA (uridine2791-2'-O)-methyltransferase
VIQDEVRAYVRDPELGRPRKNVSAKDEDGITEEDLDEMERGYIDIERQAHLEGVITEPMGQSAAYIKADANPEARLSVKERDARHGRAVDVVLSDMSEPWDQTAGFYKKSLSDPYFRMMNTSGNAFRDHAGSMVSLFALSMVSLLSFQDLCMAALTFSYDTLKTGGHFLCKFYQGTEEKAFETKLKRLFASVHREKPDSSRTVCDSLAQSARIMLTLVRNPRKLTL